ncbi:MAG: hypothetical protein ACLFQR_01715 [Desulfovibrionales bacterium]
MKIHSEHLNAVQKEQESRKSRSNTAEGFQNILDQEITQKDKPASREPAGPMIGSTIHRMDPFLQINEPQNRQPMMERLDNLLSRWDDYTRNLRSTPPDLRQAHQVLESIRTELNSMQENAQQQGGASNIGPILEELEILTVTERIKFNRGDYV